MKDFNTAYDCKNYLDEKIKTIPNGRHFAFITDTHWYENAQHSTKMMKYVLDKIGGKTVLFGGDFIDREPTSEMAIEFTKNYFNEVLSVFGDGFITVCGNHDLNTPNIHHFPPEEQKKFPIKYTELWEISMGHLTDAVFCDETEKIAKVAEGELFDELNAYFKTNFYIDKLDEKIRYIVVQTGTQNNGVVKENIGGLYGSAEIYMGLDFVYNALKTLPDGYMAVVAGHAILSALPMGGATVQLAALLYARKNCLKISLHNHTGWNLAPFFENGDHIYDFTACKPANVVCFCGDAHFDNVALVYMDENGEPVSAEYNDDLARDKNCAPVILTQCDAYRVASCKKEKGSKGDSWDMVKDTITEQCFDIVTITDDGFAVCTRFGAGLDRKIKL